MVYLRHVVKDKINSSLDLFLLALIDSGVSTAYAFKEKAGLSVGATLPAVRRLVKSGFVVRGEKLERNRQNLELTTTGKSELQNSMKHFLIDYQDHPPGDSGSVLRICAMALTNGKKLGAMKLLVAAAQDRKKRTRSLAQERSGSFAQTNLASIYLQMSKRCAAANLNAESEAFSSIIHQVSKRPK